MIAFSDEKRERKPTKAEILPTYNYVADVFCVFLSIFFGKRFDNHGQMQSHGSFYLPHTSSLSEIAQQSLSVFSHKPRKDLGIELNLSNLRLLGKILHSVFDEIVAGKPILENVELLFAAGKFYLQALELVENDPEIAFVNLVTAGEVLSNGLKFNDWELFDDELRSVLETIKEKAGQENYCAIKRRMHQVRRKFCLTLSRLLNDNFFTGSESKIPFYDLKMEDIESRLKAAYDLRSRYLHTGARFSVWVQPNCNTFADVQIGQPLVKPADWQKILAKTPTFIGLERIVRYSLLRFIHLHITPIDERLN